MPEPLEPAVARLRDLVTDLDGLVRAVGSGKRRTGAPSIARVELRPVTLKSGLHLQLSTDDGQRPTVRNIAPGVELNAALEQLFDEPFGNWHVETLTQTLQFRVTKKGEAQVHVSVTASSGTTGTTGTTGAIKRDTNHDREVSHLIHPDDPLFRVIGGNAAKRRQVDAFLRALSATVDLNSIEGPLHVVDLGCGNAYLTFAAYCYLRGLELDVTLTGVDIRADQRDRNTALAEKLGWADRVRFVATAIDGVALEVEPADITLALHACDTASDDAIAQGVRWKSRWILAAPCCHHDIASQLKAQGSDSNHLLTRHGILRERFADVLTDSLRAALLRLNGYSVEVVEFVDSTHTPRNVLIRASRSEVPPDAGLSDEYRLLAQSWGVTPKLETLL